MEFLVVLALVIGLAAGALIGWVLARGRQSAEGAGQATSLAEARGETERVRAEVERARGETERVRAELAAVRLRGSEEQNAIADAQVQAAEAQTVAAQVSAQLAAMQAQRDAARAELQAIRDDSARMVDQFKVVSSEALEKQGKSLDQSASDRLKATEQVVAPVAALLKDFQDRLTQVEKERSAIAAEMRQQVIQVTQTGETLRRETHALSTALRKPQVRGAWGEQQLRRAAEMAGMLSHCDFIEQATTINANDATIRPDMKVLFAGGKFVYVDSKVPLSAFLDAQEAQDDQARAAHMTAFGKNVKTHIDQLSAKEYWRADAGSPEFVVMFVPSDALFAEALGQMPSLYEYASQKQIVIATPSSLIGMLRTVSYSWKQAALADSAAEVFQLGRELHDRLSKMGEKFDKLGRSLTSSVKAYNETLGSLESRVLPSARRFRDLKVTEHELKALDGLDDQPRPVAAPELVENAQQVELLIGRERRDDRADDRSGDRTDQLELFRPEPSTEELVDTTQPRSLDDERRRRTSS